MFSVYNLFLFLHIVGAIVWIGASLTLTLLNWRAAATNDRPAMAALARHNAFIGGAVIGPAALLTLVAGVVMVLNARLSFGLLWISWGLGGVLLSILIGGFFVGRMGRELGRLAPTAEPGNARVVALQRRIGILSWVNLLVLLSAEAAMVFKPV